MEHSPWGRKRIRHNLATKQQTTTYTFPVNNHYFQKRRWFSCCLDHTSNQQGKRQGYGFTAAMRYFPSTGARILLVQDFGLQDAELHSFHICLPMTFEISSDVGYNLTWKESHPSPSPKPKQEWRIKNYKLLLPCFHKQPGICQPEQLEPLAQVP